MTGDWFVYQPIPISAIEGAGFTMGFSLLILIPYFLATYYLFKNRKIFSTNYKRFFVALIITALALYAAGVVHSLLNSRNTIGQRQQYENKQILVNEQFQKDVNILVPSIKPVPQYYKLFETSFIVNVPKKYFGDSKGTIYITVGSKEDQYYIDSFYVYDKLLLTNIDYKKINDETSKVVPGFNTNGDLDLTITYLINEYDGEADYKKHNISVYLEIVPEGSSLTGASYYNVKYNKILAFE